MRSAGLDDRMLPASFMPTGQCDVRSAGVWSDLKNSTGSTAGQLLKPPRNFYVSHGDPSDRRKIDNSQPHAAYASSTYRHPAGYGNEAYLASYVRPFVFGSELSEVEK